MSAKPAGRNERRRARTRGALIEAAAALFAEQGPEPTTIAQIAERADTAVGSFYNYFESKDDLLAAIVRERLAAELAQLQARQAQVEDPAEAISVAHRHLVALAEAEPEWAWLLVRLEVPDRMLNAVLGAAAMRDLIKGIEVGRFDVASPRLAALASGGALLAVIHARLLGELGADAGSEHAEGVLRSFGVAPAQAAEIARRPLPPAGVEARDRAVPDGVAEVV